MQYIESYIWSLNISDGERSEKEGYNLIYREIKDTIYYFDTHVRAAQVLKFIVELFMESKHRTPQYIYMIKIAESNVVSESQVRSICIFKLAL